MEYGIKLSETIGCYFLPHDIARSGINICATVIRENAYQYWDMIVEPAKPYFVKKVCLVGPESSGKTTLAQDLAKFYNTLYVPEYAQTFLSIKKEIHYDDLIKFAHSQIACETALSRKANKILFCDSDVLTTQLWSDTLYQKHDVFFDSYVPEKNYDLHLLCYPDIEWVHDEHREVLSEEKAKQLETRLTFFNEMEKLLQEKRYPYAVIKGTSDRFSNALDVVSKLF
jgi:HTH-type transcriptional regulator, transcriptional repressor of NAD biosynthesis genes